MDLIKKLTMGLSIVGALMVAAFLVLGAERFWGLFGDPDLGPVVFETLQRRSSPNDALACPPALCKAASDLTTPAYPVPPGELRAALAKAIATEPRLTRVASDEAALTDRYIQRSRWLGYPDTLVVQFFALPEGRSSLALYSRSKFGEGDFGVNRARIERWLAALAGVVKPAD